MVFDKMVSIVGDGSYHICFPNASCPVNSNEIHEVLEFLSNNWISSETTIFFLKKDIAKTYSIIAGLFNCFSTSPLKFIFLLLFNNNSFPAESQQLVVKPKIEFHCADTISGYGFSNCLDRIKTLDYNFGVDCRSTIEYSSSTKEDLSFSVNTMTDSKAVEQFKEITGADDATAQFFLSAANGNRDTAVTAFFDADGIIPHASGAANIPSLAGSANPSSSRTPARSTPSAVPSRPQAGSSEPSRRRVAPPRFATLGSLERERDDDEKGYYAGGEKSGQMIQDPRKHDNPDGRTGGGSNSNEDESQMGGLADAILERARRRGPRTEEERAEFEGAQTFTGAGYRLGEEGAMQARPAIVGRRNVTRVLTFYANGFRVDEGPLRPFDDPANETFLADVNRGVVPKEMEEPGVGDVSITLVDRKDVDYVEKRPSMVPFSGGGQRLDGNSNSASSSTVASHASSMPVNHGSAAAAIAVDTNRPVARIQVRLSDGTRLVACLNEDHTVGDLRQFVQASRPGVDRFTLATSFPRKVLDDDNQTVKDAELKGAVVIQTLV